MSSDPKPDLHAILSVTEQEIAKRATNTAFEFFLCGRCGSKLFHLDSERAVWTGVCEGCGNEYELQHDGTAKLTFGDDRV